MDKLLNTCFCKIIEPNVSVVFQAAMAADCGTPADPIVVAPSPEPQETMTTAPYNPDLDLQQMLARQRQNFDSIYNFESDINSIMGKSNPLLHDYLADKKPARSDLGNQAQKRKASESNDEKNRSGRPNKSRAFKFHTVKFHNCKVQ